MPLSPEWANLPRRRCDDCGKTYKPVRPRREGEMGFCCARCRKSYHKHGGAYRKLRAEVRKMLQKEAANMRTELSLAVRILVEAETRRLNAEAKELTAALDNLLRRIASLEGLARVQREKTLQERCT